MLNLGSFIPLTDSFYTSKSNHQTRYNIYSPNVYQIYMFTWVGDEATGHMFNRCSINSFRQGALLCLFSGAGPHPKGPSGRLISTIWWLFTILLLACYFGNFSLMMYSNNKPTSIQSFEDLANQDVIDYGTVEFGSTMMFFKVL